MKNKLIFLKKGLVVWHYDPFEKRQFIDFSKLIITRIDLNQTNKQSEVEMMNLFMQIQLVDNTFLLKLDMSNT